MIDFGQPQNNIKSLQSLERFRYENIFNIFKTSDSYYFYNILNKVVLPEQVSGEYLDIIKLNKKLPWTTLSYQIYGSMYLWWVIVLLNKPENIFMAEAGNEYKYIKPQKIGVVIDSIFSQINK